MCSFFVANCDCVQNISNCKLIQNKKTCHITMASYSNPSVNSSNVVLSILIILMMLYNDGSTLLHSHSLTRCCVVPSLVAKSF